MRKLFLASITLAFFFSNANAASFNCRYANKSAEIAICQDETLSRLDEQLASKYFRLKNRLPHHLWRQVRRAQKGWLRSRNRCGYNFGCIDRSYRNRISRLNGWLNNY